MTNTVMVLIYVTLAVAAVITLVLTARKSEHSILDKNLILIGSNLFLWLLMEIGLYSTQSVAFAQLLLDLKLPFVALTAFSWFYYVICFFGRDKSIPREVIVALLVIPAFTFFLSITTMQHPFIREEFILYETTPMHVYSNVRGPWFWYHTLYCYSLLAAAFVITLLNYRKVPKKQRFPATLLVLALLVVVVANMLFVFLDLAVDLSLVGGTVTFLLLFYATKNYAGLYFVIEARGSAFNHIKEGVFILDSKMKIINTNQAAKDFVAYLGLPTDETGFYRVLGKLGSRTEREVALTDEDTGTDYYLSTGRVFNIRQKCVTDNEREVLGYFVIVSDETANRELIKSLDESSGIDALTGLNNRRQHEIRLQEYDSAEHYPLAVIFGDVNNLKETNDDYGHQHGDILLRLAAGAFKNTCPPRASVSRIGGDEFVAVIPNHNEEQTLLLIENIRTNLQRESEKYPFEGSIALGYAIKYDAVLSRDELIKIADEQMYFDKRRLKADKAKHAQTKQ